MDVCVCVFVKACALYKNDRASREICHGFLGLCKKDHRPETQRATAARQDAWGKPGSSKTQMTAEACGPKRGALAGGLQGPNPTKRANNDTRSLNKAHP